VFRSVEKFVLRNISLWNLLKEATKYGILKKIVCDLGVRAHKLEKVRRFKMLLPVVFLCNALLFLTVLNSRFRLLAEAIVSGGGVFAWKSRSKKSAMNSLFIRLTGICVTKNL